MPYKRKPRTVKKTRKTIRKWKPQIRKSLRYVPMAKRFKEKIVFNNAYVTNTGYTLTAAMTAINALASYQVLYSAYRMTGFKITFLPDYINADYNQAVENNANAVPYSGGLYMHYAYDSSAPSAPASELEMLERNNCKTVLLTNQTRKPFSIYFKNPKVSIPVNVSQGGATTEFAYKNLKLNLVNSADTVHYGGVMWLRSEGTGSQPMTSILTIYFTLYNPQ